MWIKLIWRVIHPPSYFLAIEHRANKGDVTPASIDKFYKRNAKRFEDVPTDFNIFRKRVISFILGNGYHWTSYFVFHAGEVLVCPFLLRGTRSGGNSRPTCFYTKIDTMGSNLGMGADNRLVIFFLEVFLELEKFIKRLILLQPGEEMESLDFVAIANQSYDNAKK
jgi:hypothetical protein